MQGTVGGAKEELLLMPLLPQRHVLGPELHSNVAVIRLLQEF